MVRNVYIVYRNKSGENVQLDASVTELGIQSVSELNSVFMLKSDDRFAYTNVPENVTFDILINNKLDAVFNKFLDKDGVCWLNDQNIGDTLIPLTFVEKDLRALNSSDAKINDALYIVQRLINLITLAESVTTDNLFWVVSEE